MRELERRFERELVVVGVHAGKFRAERVTANIAKAVDRLEVVHPVVNDRQYRIWRSFGVGAWPTIVIVNPEDGYVGSLPGEFLADDLAPTIAGLIAEYDAHGLIDRRPLQQQGSARAAGLLRYPTKLFAARDTQLFVADTGHNRILEIAVDTAAGADARVRGRVARIIGTGERGRQDGPAHRASFAHPHGMVVAGTSGSKTLFVADTENHLVRAVDLETGDVTTVFGTGEQARRPNVAGAALDTALNSPWDLAYRDGALTVAMAGAHQLWRLDLNERTARPWVGTGREDLSDGPAERCTLAQPTGVQPTSSRLFFADSESSAVRYVAWDQGAPVVTTVVGRGLFEFGDEDGTGSSVRLQHPYGITAHGAELYVADTYNHKIKRLSVDGRSESFAGSGVAGFVDGDPALAEFSQPQGVSAGGDRLFVADTDNHAVRVIDLAPVAGRAPVVMTLAIEE